LPAIVTPAMGHMACNKVIRWKDWCIEGDQLEVSEWSLYMNSKQLNGLHAYNEIRVYVVFNVSLIIPDLTISRQYVYIRGGKTKT
jgi:hypothetical protein